MQNSSHIEHGRLLRASSRSHSLSVLAFALPFLILWVAYAVRGVFPFGDRHILTVDLYHQYAPFLAELRRKILSGDTLFFTWQAGLGIGFLPLFAYYLASPLNIILVLFPPAYLAEAVLTLTLVKVGLSGLTFQLYLKKRYQLDSPLTLSTAVAYALSSYTIAYSWNIMWLDTLILLPVVILGLVRLVQDRRSALFVLSFGMTILVNFYTAFFVGLFVGLYFIVLLNRYHSGRGLVSGLKSILRFVGSALLGAALSAVLAYPTWTALRQTSAAGDQFPEKIETYANLFDYFGQHMMLQKPTIRDGLPNLYATVLILIVVPLFFMSRRIRLSDKLFHLGLFAFLIASFDVNILNFIWHGFHFPNQLPYRNSFVYIFLLLTMLFEAYVSLSDVRSQDVASVTLIACLAVLLSQNAGLTNSTLAVWLTLAFLVLLAAALPARRATQRRTSYWSKIIAALMVIEVIVSTIFGIRYVDKNEYFGSRDGYAAGLEVDSIRNAVQQIADGDPAAFYRTEIVPDKTSNDAALYGLRGFTVFSSTLPRSPVTAIKNLGFSSNGINSFKYDGSTILMDSILSLRYLIQRDDVQINERTRSLVLENEEITVWQNPNALPIGMVCDPAVLSWTSQEDMTFANQNTLAKSMGSPSTILVATAIDPIVENAQKLALLAEEVPKSGKYAVTKTHDESESRLKLSLTASGAGTHYVSYNMQTTKVKTFNAVIGGKTLNVRVRRPGVFDLGYLNVGESVSIELQLESESPKQSKFQLQATRLDAAAFSEFVSVMNREPFSLTKFGKRGFEGTVDLDKERVLMFSILADQGWSAVVDGQDAPIELIDGAFIALRIPAGQHHIEMHYVPAGFTTGLYVTLVDLRCYSF